MICVQSDVCRAVDMKWYSSMLLFFSCSQDENWSGATICTSCVDVNITNRRNNAGNTDSTAQQLLENTIFQSQQGLNKNNQRDNLQTAQTHMPILKKTKEENV